MNDMTQIVHARRAKGTLREFDKKIVGLKATQNSMQVLHVINQGLAIYQDVIKEHNDKSTEKKLQDAVHNALECV